MPRRHTNHTSHGVFYLTLLWGMFMVVLLNGPVLFANDWPQFRGPDRDGKWNETGILESFPPGGLDIRWRHPVGGGWPSPVVAQGRVFLFDVELIKPMARERLHCFEEKTGKLLWLFSYEETYDEWTYVPERGAGPTATPIVEGERIYTVGASGFTHCLDVKRGAVIWKKRIGKEYQVAEMSCRPSPLIEGPLLIVFTGAKPGASVMALDKMTGKEVWSNGSLASLNPATGEIFWREPMTTSGNDSAATPVFEDNRLLVSGLMVNLSAAQPRFLWPAIRTPSKRVLSNTSTAVLRGKYLYSAKGFGELVCLDADTGAQIWSTNGVTELTISPIFPPRTNSRFRAE